MVMRKRKFTDNQLRELYNKRLNDREISKRFNCTPSAVHLRRKKLKLESKARISNDELNEIKRLWELGLNDREIGEKLHKAQQAILYRRRKLKLEPNQKRKFTDQQLIELHGRGLIDREIAEKFNTVQSVVCIRRNKLGLKPNGRYKLEDEKIIDLHDNGYIDRKIAEVLGYSESYIQYRRNKLGLEAHQKNELKFTDQQLLDEKNKGLSDTQISEKFDCSLVAIYSRKRKLGLPIKRHLKDQDLIDAYNSGKFNNDRELARYLGYCELTIRNKRHKLGLESIGIYSNEEIEEVDMEKFMELYNQKLSDEKIAMELNIPRARISRKRGELGLESNYR